MAAVRRILIIDDNVDAADLIGEVFRMSGMSVEVAYGGREGLAAAKAMPPDVIFLDIGMPFMDGYQVAEALRGEATMRGVKIVALTAWGDESSRKKSKDAGFDMHLTKPAGITDLINLARSHDLG